MSQLEYIIHRQQLLEALSWQGGGGHRHALLPWKPVKASNNEIDGELEIEVVVNLLKSLERSCPSHVSMTLIRNTNCTVLNYFYFFSFLED
jgi:hypothetical protein